MEVEMATHLAEDAQAERELTAHFEEEEEEAEVESIQAMVWFRV